MDEWVVGWMDGWGRVLVPLTNQGFGASLAGYRILMIKRCGVYAVYVLVYPETGSHDGRLQAEKGPCLTSA